MKNKARIIESDSKNRIGTVLPKASKIPAFHIASTVQTHVVREFEPDLDLLSEGLDRSLQHFETTPTVDNAAALACTKLIAGSTPVINDAAAIFELRAGRILSKHSLTNLIIAMIFSVCVLGIGSLIKQPSLSWCSVGYAIGSLVNYSLQRHVWRNAMFKMNL